MQTSKSLDAKAQGGEAASLGVAAKQPLQPSNTNQLVLQAARVAIHVRPRSPRLSPTSYVPLDASLSAWSPTRHDGSVASALLPRGPGAQPLGPQAAVGKARIPEPAVRPAPEPEAAIHSSVGGAQPAAGGAGERLLADLMGPSLRHEPSVGFGHGPAAAQRPAAAQPCAPAQPGSLHSSSSTATAAQRPAQAAPTRSPGLAEAPLLAASWASGVWPSVAVGGPRDPEEEEARRARRRHRKRVARIVVDHWKAFAAGRLRALAAKRHYRKRLLTAALVAWQSAAVAARVKLRQAAVHDLKRVFLSLGRCVQAWHAVATRQAELRLLQARGEEAVAARRARVCMRAWRGRCHYAADKKRRELQAWYYWSFSSLTRVLRKWHAWARERRRKVHRAARADMAHVAALGRKAFAGWRLRLAYRGWKGQALERAAVFQRRWSLWRALSGWRRAAVACQGARAAACAALEVAAERGVVVQLRSCLTEWRAYAAHRRRRAQRGRYAEAYMRRWRQLLLMWGWRQAMARQRHLRRCELVFAQVGQRVRLGLAWSRWTGAVALLQGQRNAELRALVQLRAAWAAWWAVMEHRAAKLELLAVATKRVGLVRLRASIMEWRARAAHWRHKAERWERAETWHRRRALAKLMAAWRREAARLAAKAAAGEAAVLHWAWRLLSGAFKTWRRFAWRRRMKLEAPERYRTRLAATALASWMRHTRYQVEKEIKRRRAVRHRYLALLRAGLRAFRAAVERRRAKLADWADLELLHRRLVARTVLAAWRRDFLPAAAAKRAAVRGAERQWRAGMLRRAWLGWTGEARRLRAKHEGVRQARGYCSLRLLRRVLACWAAARPLAEAARADKAAQLAAARYHLGARAKARLLAAWRDVTSDLIVKHLLEARAERLWRGRVLGRAMTSWALFVAARRRRHIREAQATAAYRLRMWRAVLVALALNAQRRRAKRRQAAIAEEHQRLGLLRRGVAALVWYARYRSVKAQGYAAARQAYGRRLAREGAALWLEVGLERRRRRIQNLATAQAHRIARELAIVEPFARRWLYAVRQRRRERLIEAAAAAVGRAGTYWATGGSGGGYPAGGSSGGLGARPAAGLAAAAAPVLRREGLWAGGNPYLALGRPVPAQQGQRQQPDWKERSLPAVLAEALPQRLASTAVQLGQGGLSSPGLVSPSGRRPPPRTPPSVHMECARLALHAQQHQRGCPGGPQEATLSRPAGAPTAAPAPATTAAPHGMLGFLGGQAAAPGALGYAGVCARGQAAAAASTATAAAAEAVPLPAALSQPRRARPAPRCPDFLQQPQQQLSSRPATVSGTGGSRLEAIGPSQHAGGISGLGAWHTQLSGHGYRQMDVHAPHSSSSGGGGVLTNGAVLAGLSQQQAQAQADDWGFWRSRPHTVAAVGGGGGGSAVRGGEAASQAPSSGGGRAGGSSGGGHPPSSGAAALFFANLGPSHQLSPQLQHQQQQQHQQHQHQHQQQQHQHQHQHQQHQLLHSGRAAAIPQAERELAALIVSAGTAEASLALDSGSRPLTAGGGIAIHQPGAAPPDVLRLPTGGAAGAAAPGGEASDGGTPARTDVLQELGAGRQQASSVQATPGGRMAAGRVLSWQSTCSPLHPAVPARPHQPQPQAPPAQGTDNMAQRDGNGEAVRLVVPPAAAVAEAMPSSDRATAGRSDAEAEMDQLEQVLLHCRDLKRRLRELEQPAGNGGSASVAGDVGGGGGSRHADVAAGLELEAEAEGGAAVVEVGRLVAELAELRPVVEYAAMRLGQLRIGPAAVVD
ncbi:hypothetical protein HYH02_003150 [Chlamydomonas schloesseri]|uniref:Sfi1 spindle body domain-containing protein n=1 Tax=Chlamydomonas schloesseri TaxID=2026947 RepID=A0A835WSP6_9CHLO|nr:hypothetical protein HYH02_003150 [Chlamydomonas schloesseri]|eukprot:KAG2452116.1 hypothetical protein HYH02_003150 [Chlamydomonas schloesseri]